MVAVAGAHPPGRPTALCRRAAGRGRSASSACAITWRRWSCSPSTPAAGRRRATGDAEPDCDVSSGGHARQTCHPCVLLPGQAAPASTKPQLKLTHRTRYGANNASRRFATSRATRNIAATSRSSISVAPSYSARFLLRWAWSSTRYCSGGRSRVCGKHWNTT